MWLRPWYLHYGHKALADGANEDGVARGSDQQLLSVHVRDGTNRPKLLRNLPYFFRKAVEAERALASSRSFVQQTAGPIGASGGAWRGAEPAAHLALLLGCQVGAPADHPAVFAATAQHSAPLQRAQGEHAALVGSSLPHDLVGLWWGGRDTPSTWWTASAGRPRCDDWHFNSCPNFAFRAHRFISLTAGVFNVHQAKDPQSNAAVKCIALHYYFIYTWNMTWLGWTRLDRNWTGTRVD